MRFASRALNRPTAKLRAIALLQACPPRQAAPLLGKSAPLSIKAVYVPRKEERCGDLPQREKTADVQS